MVILVAGLFLYAANKDDTALLLINSQDFRVNIKNYLEVYVKIVPACNLFITISAIFLLFRYFLLRISLGGCQKWCVVYSWFSWNLGCVNST